MKIDKALEVLQDLIVVQEQAHKHEESLVQDRSLQIYKDLVTRQARERAELEQLFDALQANKIDFSEDSTELIK